MTFYINLHNHQSRMNTTINFIFISYAYYSFLLWCGWLA